MAGDDQDPDDPATRTVLCAAAYPTPMLGTPLADDHDRLLRGIVTRHGGTIVRLRPDGCLARFDSADAGVRAAVSLMRNAERERRTARPGHELHFRAGMSSGDVTGPEGELRGQAIEEASRLCLAAEQDEILCGELTLSLRRGGPPQASIPSSPGRDLPAGVPVVSITWQGSGQATAPIPTELATLLTAGYVGRDAEVARLGDRWQRRATATGTVWITGETGSGKSRLAAELADRAATEGAVVALGADAVDEILRNDAVSGRPILAVLEGFGSGTSLDHSTLDAVRRRLRKRDHLVIATSRHAAPRGSEVDTVIALRPLTFTDVLGYVEEAIGGTVPSDWLGMLAELHQMLGGNPGYLVAALTSFTDEGYVAFDGSWNVDLEAVAAALVPPAVRDDLVARVTAAESADPLLGALVRVLAIVSRPLEAAVLAEVVGEPVTAVLDALVRAVSEGLVELDADATFRLRHGALVDILAAAPLAHAEEDRIDLHRRVARALRRRGNAPADVIAVAHHSWEARTVLEPRLVQTALHRAADLLIVRGRPAEAATLYRRAATVGSETPSAAVDTQVKLGIAAELAGDPSHRELLLEAVDLAFEHDLAAMAVGAVIVNSRNFWSGYGTVDVERVERLERVLASMDGTEEPWAAVAGTLAAELSFSDDRARLKELRDAVLDRARREVGGSADDIRHQRVAIGLARLAGSWFGSPETALTIEASDILDALAASTGSPAVRRCAASVRLMVSLQNGDRAAADLALAREATAVGAAADPASRWALLVHRASMALLDGDLAQAKALAAESVAAGEATGQPDTWFAAAAVDWVARLLWGTDLVIPDAVVTAVLADPDRWRPLLIMGLLESNHDEARRWLGRAVADGFADLARWPDWPSHAVMYARAAEILGDDEAGALLVERLEPHAALLAVTASGTVVGAIGTVLAPIYARVGRHSDAVRVAAKGMTAADRVGSPVFGATARLAMARALMGRDIEGDREAARGLVRDAELAARRYGGAPIWHEAYALGAELDPS